MKKKYKNKIDLKLLSDLELLDNIYNSQDCNQKAIGELYDRYLPAACSYLMGMYNGDRERACTLYNDTFINVINFLETKEAIKDNNDFNFKK